MQADLNPFGRTRPTLFHCSFLYTAAGRCVCAPACVYSASESLQPKANHQSCTRSLLLHMHWGPGAKKHEIGAGGRRRNGGFVYDLSESFAMRCVRSASAVACARLICSRSVFATTAEWVQRSAGVCAYARTRARVCARALLTTDLFLETAVLSLCIPEPAPNRLMAPKRFQQMGVALCPNEMGGARLSFVACVPPASEPVKPNCIASNAAAPAEMTAACVRRRAGGLKSKVDEADGVACMRRHGACWAVGGRDEDGRECVGGAERWHRGRSRE